MGDLPPCERVETVTEAGNAVAGGTAFRPEYTAWLKIVGPWRPIDEERYQWELKTSQQNQTAEDVGRTFLNSLPIIGQIAQAVLPAASDVSTRLLKNLHIDETPNPLTSRPAGGVPNWEENYLPLPYYVDPALIPLFQKNQATTLAAMRRYRVSRVGYTKAAANGSCAYMSYRVVDLQAGPTGAVVKGTSGSGGSGIGLTDTRIVVPLSSGVVVSSGGSGASSSSPSPSSPSKTPSRSPFPYLVGGALFLGLGYILTRRSPSR